jgi:hypothetical protein
MAIFNSYVKLPEGRLPTWCGSVKNFMLIASFLSFLVVNGKLGDVVARGFAFHWEVPKF